MNLLTHFAALHVPTSSTKPEACPVCSQSFPLSELAEHVYECIKSLDDVERKEQERLDEKMARQLMEREMKAVRQQESLDALTQQAQARFQSNIGAPCPHSAECSRTDAQHFINQSHPTVDCPLCAHPFQVYEVNAHINLCLNDPDAASKAQARKRVNSNANFTSMSDATMTTTMNEGEKSEPLNAAFTTVRDSSQLLTRQDSDVRKLPLRSDDSDDDENEDADGDAESDPELLAATRSSSDLPRLTVEQASAMASMVIARRDALVGRGAVFNNPNDPSLVQLLDTFKMLGFTQEGLSRLKEAENARGSLAQSQSQSQQEE